MHLLSLPLLLSPSYQIDLSQNIYGCDDILHGHGHIYVLLFIISSYSYLLLLSYLEPEYIRMHKHKVI